jgi:hypothetical protein
MVKAIALIACMQLVMASSVINDYFDFKLFKQPFGEVYQRRSKFDQGRPFRKYNVVKYAKQNFSSHYAISKTVQIQKTFGLGDSSIRRRIIVQITKFGNSKRESTFEKSNGTSNTYRAFLSQEYLFQAKSFRRTNMFKNFTPNKASNATKPYLDMDFDDVTDSDDTKAFNDFDD